MKTEDAIAGALFDFLGFLTTRDHPTAFGSREHAGPAADLLKEWAGTKGLRIDDADVENWRAALAAAPEAPASQADGWSFPPDDGPHTAQAEKRMPMLTDERLDEVIKAQWGRLPAYATYAAYRAYARAIERACAQAWGIQFGEVKS